jgi:ElaB/YqjD/DUF883 family membrane-anchored ribosome-binding protein
MNEPQIRLKLSRFPGDKLIRIAVEVLGHRGVTTKGEAIDFLTQLVTENRKTLDEVLVLVQNAKPYVPLPEVQPDPRLDEALTNIQDRLHDLGKAVELKAQAAVEKAERDVHAKLAGVKAADAGLISETIRAEVERVFAPFKQSAEVEVLAEVAARLPSFRLERAGDLFPCTAYDGVDFGDLQVGFWSDPEAPALVDDYVFNPTHLHQALIALDDAFPHNTWLAGERGTGKTEFVTQLAARLGRKLVRVNFDEALEGPTLSGPIPSRAVTLSGPRASSPVPSSTPVR